jgi:hypothetical protein
MRRAIPLLVLLLLSLPATVPVKAQNRPQIVSQIDGFGLLDYSRPPRFQVGDWVEYHMTGSSALGMSDDYRVTVLIAGEEEFWGERCFWIETWTEHRAYSPSATAALVSYKIFDDPLPMQRMRFYRRKAISGLDMDGNAQTEVVRVANSSLRSRTLLEVQQTFSFDTLGTDTVQTPMGDFTTLKVMMRQGRGATATVGDSSMYNEVRENRLSYWTDAVPLTRLAREDIENLQARRTWAVGRSSESTALNIRERGLGVARLVGFGSGKQARLVPEKWRKPLPAKAAASTGSARRR